MSDAYTCEACNESFSRGWSDEEAAAEAADNFPGLAERDRAVVCDDCYRKIMGLPPVEEAS